MFRKRRLATAVVLLIGSITWATFLQPGEVGNAAVAKGATQRVSVIDDGDAGPGTQATYASYESQISGDGTQSAFVSQDALDPKVRGADGGEGCAQCSPNAIFVRDTSTHRTVQISMSTNGGEDGPGGRTVYRTTGNEPRSSSDEPSISYSGRYVSFVTQASNVAGGPGSHDVNEQPVTDDGLIVVCDRDPDNDGKFDEPDPDDDSADPPAQYVCIAVHSIPYAIGLDGWPRLSGGTKTEPLRIVWAETTQYTIPDGEFPVDETSDQVYTTELAAPNGQLTPPSPDDISSLPGGDGLSPNGPQLTQPQISQDGSTVVARSREEVPVPDGDGETETTYSIIEVSIGPGSADAQRRRVDADVTKSRFVGSADTDVQHPTVSANGTVVAFDARPYVQTSFRAGPSIQAAPSVQAAQSYALGQSYAVNTTSSDEPLQSVRVSAPYRGTGEGDGQYPWVSADGRYVAFATDKPDMHEGRDATAPSYSGCVDGFDSDINPPDRGSCQVVARDLKVDATRLAAGKSRLPAQLASVSIKADCGADDPATVCAGNDDSQLPSLSADGSAVGFESVANDLVEGDTNTASEGESGGEGADGISDVFLRTWQTTLTASNVNFGQVKFGASSDRTTTITAGGFGPVQVNGVKIAGANAGDFTILSTTCSKTVPLHETETCTVSVRFTPGALGSRTGRVDVYADGNATTPKKSIVVTGTGSRTPPKHADITVNPGTVNFGSDIPLHTPGKSKVVTVVNSGGSTLTVTSATVQDTTVPGAKADYTVDASRCSAVPAGGSCTISVTFIGHAVGTRPAVLVIISNAPGGSNSIAITAVIPAPKITVNPGVTPPGRVTTVSGTGFAPNRMVGIRFTTSGETAEPKTDAKGEFTVGLVVFPNTDEGPRTVMAQAEGVSSTIRAEAPLLVVLGTLQSPRLKIRH